MEIWKEITLSNIRRLRAVRALNPKMDDATFRAYMDQARSQVDAEHQADEERMTQAKYMGIWLNVLRVFIASTTTTEYGEDELFGPDVERTAPRGSGPSAPPSNYRRNYRR